MFIGLLALPGHAVGPPPVEQWIVVHPPAYTEALEPLIAHRRAQGLRIVSVRTTDVLTAQDLQKGDGSALRAHLRKLCRHHPGPSSILLVGGVNPSRPPCVPALPGTIGRMKGEPSDGGYGCLDGSRLPTVAVGRWPARTADEVKAMVAKTLTFERGSSPGVWRRKLTVLAGIPAYNPVVDRLIENVAFARFDRIHPAWMGQAIYTSAQSRFCVPDRLLRKQAIDFLHEGQAIILYLGHSNAEGLYAGPTAAFLDRDDWARLAIKTGSVFITFGCNGCQLAGRDGEGYAVHAVRNPRGPVAAIGSHGICFAAMVQLASDGLFERAFQNQLPRTIGDCWLATLAGIAKGKIDFLSYRMLDAVDGDSRIPQATQRQEHLEMFVLLGDPALRLPQIADDITLRVEKMVTPGKPLVLHGRLPERLANATVQVSLERSPASVPADLEPVPAMPVAERERVMLANHRRANQFRVIGTTTIARAGVFAVKLEVPAKLPWPRLILRVHASNGKHEALTTERLGVRAAETKKDTP
jgi:hypothetical protein